MVLAVDLVQGVAHAALVVLCLTIMEEPVLDVQEPHGQLQPPQVVQVKFLLFYYSKLFF